MRHPLERDEQRQVRNEEETEPLPMYEAEDPWKRVRVEEQPPGIDDIVPQVGEQEQEQTSEQINTNMEGRRESVGFPAPSVRNEEQGQGQGPNGRVLIPDAPPPAYTV